MICEINIMDEKGVEVIASIINCKLNGKDEKVRLCVEWNIQKAIKILISKESSQEELSGELTLEDLKNSFNKFVGNSNNIKTFEEYIKKTKQILSGNDPDIVFSFDEDKNELWWSKSILEMGSLIYKRADEKQKFKFFGLVVDNSVFMREKFDALQEKHNVLLQNYDKLNDKFNKMSLEKNEWEQTLYVKFLKLLNSKKQRIVELENNTKKVERNNNTFKNAKNEKVYEDSTEESADEAKKVNFKNKTKNNSSQKAKDTSKRKTNSIHLTTLQEKRRKVINTQIQTIEGSSMEDLKMKSNSTACLNNKENSIEKDSKKNFNDLQDQSAVPSCSKSYNAEVEENDDESGSTTDCDLDTIISTSDDKSSTAQCETEEDCDMKLEFEEDQDPEATPETPAGPASDDDMHFSD